MAKRKGIVMETGKGWAIILTENGEYHKIKTNDFMEVGEQYQEKFSLPLSYIAAAVIILALSLTTLDYYSVKAYAQVSSLAELGVNRWGRVVSVQAKNEAGQQILNKVELKNDTLEVAVEKIYAHDFKDEQDNQLPVYRPEISVTGADKKETKLEEKMLKKINQGLKKAEKARNKAEIQGLNDCDYYDEEELDTEKKGKDNNVIWEDEEIWGNNDLDIDDIDDIDDLDFNKLNEKIQNEQEKLKEQIEKKPYFINEGQMLLPLESKRNFNSYKNKWDKDEDIDD